ATPPPPTPPRRLLLARYSASISAFPHLLTVGLKQGPPPGEPVFPFSVSAIATMPSLDLSARVTCFVGENGSGKSTLLEGIAAAAALPTVGATEIGRDGTLEAQRRLAKAPRPTCSN